MKNKIALIFLISTFVSGCSTTFVEQIMEKDYQSFYLRGVFTWWEADENYRIEQVNGNLYKATVKLIADGQPYDFKFADENYTPGYDCGSPAGTAGKVLTVGKAAKSSCENPGGNFQFTPNETGAYDFFIDFTNELAPVVYIEKA
ncbi:early set domain-containing protein [Aliiglaciecola aliphaticivorans]